MSPSLLDFLKHILHECSYILEVRKEKHREEVLGDETLSKAIVRSLEIIGGATKKIPVALKTKYPQVNWADMAGMRDVLIHNYFGVDYDVVWNTICNDIPELQYQLQNIIKAESK
jgi:uncharacterized protein with HEPN domain